MLGDAVLSQTETQYDASGNATFVITRDRFHNEPLPSSATAAGELATPTSTTLPKARVSYVGNFYDAANRATNSVNYGTNGGTVLTSRPPTVPSPPDPALVSGYGYAADEVQRVKITGSSGTFTLTFAGQTTAPITYNAATTASAVQAALQPAVAAAVRGERARRGSQRRAMASSLRRDVGGEECRADDGHGEWSDGDGFHGLPGW